MVDENSNLSLILDQLKLLNLEFVKVNEKLSGQDSKLDRVLGDIKIIKAQLNGEGEDVLTLNDTHVELEHNLVNDSLNSKEPEIKEVEVIEIDKGEMNEVVENVKPSKSRKRNKNKKKFYKIHSFQDIFSISLIKENIVKNMKVAEMKNLRLASKKLNKEMMTSSVFLNRTRLLIRETEIKKMGTIDNLHTVNHLRKVSWKNLKIEMNDKEGNVNFRSIDIFNKIFTNCVDLILTRNRTFEGGEPPINDKKVENLSNFFIFFSSLRILEMDYLYCYAFMTMNLKPNEIQILGRIFENLREFKIQPSLNCQRESMNPFDLKKCKIMEIFSNIKNLIKFEFPRDNSPAGSYNARSSHRQTDKVNIFQIGIYNFAAQSISTIVSLDLNFNEFPDITEMNLVFPQLKSLTLSDYCDKYLNFFEIQPLEQLESLSLTLSVCQAHVEIIKRRCKNLEKFYLDSYGMKKEVEGEEGYYFEWKHDFLSCFQNLSQFSLQFPIGKRSEQVRKNPNNGTILSHLNVSKLEELTIRGMSLFGFPSFSQLENGNLTRLSLIKCHNSLNDKNLQFIARNTILLQVLEFSDCDQITDYGITGRRRGETKIKVPICEIFAIDNLKQLKVLRMMSCKNITNYSCTYGMKFNNLELLDLSYRTEHQTQITSLGIAILLENNPALKELYMCHSLKQALPIAVQRTLLEYGIGVTFYPMEVIHRQMRDLYRNLDDEQEEADFYDNMTAEELADFAAAGDYANFCDRQYSDDESDNEKGEGN